MSKPYLIVLLVLVLTGCSTYLREREAPAPIKDSVPDGCVVLYKHQAGDRKEADEYVGVYCPADIEVEVSP